MLKKLLIFILFLPACAGKTVKHKDFDPLAPVEIRRPSFRYKLDIYQMGEHFQTQQMFDHLKKNNQASKKISKAKTYYYSGLFLLGASGVVLFTADKAAGVWTALTVFGLGFGASYYGKKKFEEVGRIHNRQLSSIGLGLMPVAQNNSVVPALVFATDL